MAEPRYACRRCGTWTCSVPLCGGSRAGTDIRYDGYPCTRCRGREGVLVPTMHTARMWRLHNDGPLPVPYPYGSRPGPSEWAEGFGPRTVPPVLYRGVPLPDETMDYSAFMRGVDAALDMTEEESK